MKLINSSLDPIISPALGINEPLQPGEVVELDDVVCLRTSTVAWGDWKHGSSTAEKLTGGRLSPATPEDQHRYDTVSIEDLPAQVAMRERAAAELKRGMAEAFIGGKVAKPAAILPKDTD